MAFIIIIVFLIIRILLESPYVGLPLTDIERIHKLFALALVSFVWAYKEGIYLNSLCPIKIKKHGRKA
jgi:hypothetical protein